MDLLQEAKKSNKQAFNELVTKYNHIFYKTARIYFTDDKDVSEVIQNSLTQSFREIVNVKTEKEFICWTLKILLQNSEQLRQINMKDIDKKINSKQITVNITDKISSSETKIGSAEYQAYRKASVVEEYLTSIQWEYRVPSLLYFYADLSIQDISKILKISEANITKIIDKSRITIYEMIKNKEVDL